MSDLQDRSQELLLLGQIHGLVQALKDGQDQQHRRMDSFDLRFDAFDGRLRSVEQRAAVLGATSGGAVGLGSALLIEGVKQWLHTGVGG